MSGHDVQVFVVVATFGVSSVDFGHIFDRSFCPDKKILTGDFALLTGKCPVSGCYHKLCSVVLLMYVQCTYVHYDG